MNQLTELCAGCNHPIGYHFMSIDGKVRCLHQVHGTTSSGIIGIPYVDRCDCVNSRSEKAQQAQQQMQQEAQRAMHEAQQTMKEIFMPYVQQAGIDINKLMKEAQSMATVADAALKLAESKHKRQKRRDGSPYFGHCKNVGTLAKTIAKELNCTEEEQINCEAAGYDHDTIEDTATDWDDIADATNPTVANIVAAVSDDKRRTAVFRHELFLKQLAEADKLAQIVKLADIHDNVNDALLLLRTTVRPPLKFLNRWVPRARAVMDVLDKVKSSIYYDIVSRQLLPKLEEQLGQINQEATPPIDKTLKGTARYCQKGTT